MKFGSLFSGIGGFDAGLEQAGLTCSWQVEIDADCNRVLERHWPGVMRYKDVREVGKLEPVDVICGGFPCQDLSVAGKRAGLAGERSGLWFEFLRIVGLNRPRWLVIENVPGLLSSDEGRDFAVILRGLVECGYCLAWRIVDAQFYGVAQRRRRVFIVGSLGDGGCAEILFESESVSWNPPARGEAGPGVTPILEAGARTNGDGRRDGDGIGLEGDPMFTLQSGKQHAVAATLDQRGRGPTDAVMRNLQIAGSLAAHTKEHGHAMTTQQAAESNHLVVMPLKAKANSSHDESHETYVYHENIDGKVYESPECPALRGFQKDALMVTHALRSEGADASEDGTGRGTPIIPIDMRQASRGAKMTNNRPNGSSGGAPGTGIGNAGDPCPTIADSHVPAVFGLANCFNGHIGGSDDNDAQANHIVSVDLQNTRTGGDVVGTLDTARPSRGGGQAVMAFTERTRSDGRNFESQEELAYAITNPGSGGRTHSRQVAGHFGVRRLTPRECERLMGLPDDYTRWDAAGREISDSARYRMLGNSIVVPVARWIGERLKRNQREGRGES